MQQIQNLRNIWQRGECAINGWLSLPCGFSAELMAKQNWDSLTIDAQHGLVDYAAMVAMLTAASEKPVLVRAAWLAEAEIMKALDAGAAGVICPMVNNRADAQRFAECVRYPPRGRRSFGPVRALQHFGSDYYAQANDCIIALAMIETQEGVRHVDEIISVEGIDGVYIGPADLSCSLGHEPTFAPTAAEVLRAIDSVLAAAQKQNCIAGIHTNDVATAQAMRAKGFNFITAATDTRMLSATAADILLQLQSQPPDNRKEANDENKKNDNGANAGGIPSGATY